MLFGLGTPEILIILVVVLVIFGPKNLPKLGSALGKTVKNVREGMEGEEEESSEEKTEGEETDAE
jgi:sec-independent protein translocase protein TatA